MNLMCRLVRVLSFQTTKKQRNGLNHNALYSQKTRGMQQQALAQVEHIKLPGLYPRDMAVFPMYAMNRNGRLSKAVGCTFTVTDMR